LVEVTDMEMESELEDQDINLMLRASKVVPLSQTPPKPQLVLSDQGEGVLLEDDLETNVYNMAFDETQHTIL